MLVMPLDVSDIWDIFTFLEFSCFMFGWVNQGAKLGLIFIFFKFHSGVTLNQ